MEKSAAPRAMNSADMYIAVLKVPVKMYTATVKNDISFKQISPLTNTPVKQKLWDEIEDKAVDKESVLKGYEVSKDEFVIFTKEEIKALEAERDGALQIKEFVPLSAVDFLYVEKSYYLGPGKGGDQAFSLVCEAMKESGMVALGHWANRGKEQLVLIRPYMNGMILHQLHHANEVRDNDNIGPDKKFTHGEKEKALAKALIAKMAGDSFRPEKYRDEYAERVMAAVERKKAGTLEVNVAEQPKARVVDLAEALAMSLNALDKAG